MNERSIAHGDFVVKRSYPAAPTKVFAAWADPKLKAKWFGGGEGEPAQIFEFKVGGREYSAGKGPGGADYTFDVTYQDIVPDNRIVYTYDMTIGGKRISVSLATIEFLPEGSGTNMIVTEKGAFLDGLDTVQAREEGTNFLIDQLGTFLAKS